MKPLDLINSLKLISYSSCILHKNYAIIILSIFLLTERGHPA
nr:MAG TPA: hypothetical protein [Caudoviricetes sp.]